MNKRMRSEMSAGLSKRSVIQDWAYANSLSPKDFDAQISSTVNRFHTFLHNERLRLMFCRTIFPVSSQPFNPLAIVAAVYSKHIFGVVRNFLISAAGADKQSLWFNGLPLGAREY